jgi:protein-S-isoprenylcysteine O-methyltransferase Ste14
VTSAFIACIYAIVALSVVATGVLNEWFSLPLSVDAIAIVLIVLSLAAAAWQMNMLRARPRPTSTSQRSTVAAPDERLFG